MRTLTKNAFFALIAAASLSACSRPYATFQKSAPEHFYTKKADAVAPVTALPAATVADETPVVAEAPVASAETPAVAVAAPVAVAQPTASSVRKQLNEALASNKTQLSGKQKLNARMTGVMNMINSADEKQLSTTTSQKMGKVATMIAKSVDKKIQKHMGPKAAKSSSAIRLGIIVGIIGLLLIIIGNSFFSTLGVIALVVGLLGILLGYLDVI